MSKANPKEVTEELERQAWKLRMKCWTQDEIALELGVSQAVVSRMLKRTGKKLSEAFVEEMAQMRAEQTGQLLNIARSALAAWDQIQQETAPSPATAQEPQDTPPPPSEDAPKRRPAAGAAYLKVALQAFAAIRALWGMQDEKNRDIKPPDYGVKFILGVSEEEFRNGVREPKVPQ